MKIKLFDTSFIRALACSSFVSLAILVPLSLAAVSHPGLQEATYTQSMLMVSGFSALTLALLVERKAGNWWAKFSAEGINALTAMLTNLLIGRIVVGIFAGILASSRPLFGTALRNANTFFLLGSAFFIYMFFRLFLLCWRYLDHLRRQYFTWSLTYYFLVIVVCLAFAFLLVVTVFFSDRKSVV